MQRECIVVGAACENRRYPRIFIAEDSPLIALDLEDAVLQLGGEVVGPSRDLSEALDIVGEDRAVDIAIIDFVLRDGTSEALIEALRARSIPVVLYTGLMRRDVEALFPDVTVVTKPHSQDGLLAILRDLAVQRGSPPV